MPAGGEEHALSNSARIAQQLRDEQLILAEAVVTKAHTAQPHIWGRYGEEGRKHCVRDAGYHLAYLAEAIEVQDPELFVSYAEWVKVLFHSIKLPPSTLCDTLNWMKDAIAEHVNSSESELAASYIDAALTRLPSAGLTVETHLTEDNPHYALANSYLQALLRGSRQEASSRILDAVEQGVSVEEVYLQVFQPVQYELGRLWQTARISVAQEHFATACTQLVMSQLYPRILGAEKTRGRIVSACVGGELHEMGIRMATDLLEMDGWDTYYLGANVPLRSVVQTVQQMRPALLGVSATMTFHVPHVVELISAVREAVGDEVRIIVGGYPFHLSRKLHTHVGADGFAADGLMARALAAKLCEGA
ncbi:MAG: cobalamin B12-binding domain protein [Chitinivibrionales bacterium]|nr:cobalamin B12-binding domain protein [Chitinivibrionales bacterium]